MSEPAPDAILHEDDEAAIAAAGSILAGGDPERIAGLAEAALSAVAGERSWERERVLHRLTRIENVEPLLPALADALSDPDRADRRNAARTALAAMSRPGSRSCDRVVALLERLLGSPDPDVRLLSAMALGESGNAGSRGPLERLLSDRNPNVAASAAEALGMLGDRRAVDALARVAAHEDFWTRAAAVVSLGRLRDPRAIPFLARAAREEGIAPAVATALGEIGDPAGLEALRGMLEDGTGLRDQALAATARIFGAQPDAPVPDWLRRAAAADVAATARRFSDTSDPAAARLLGIAASEESVNALFDAIDDPEHRTAAAVGIGLLPPETARQRIFDGLSRAEPEIQALLLDRLPDLRAGDPLDGIVELLGAEEVATRAAAAALLARSDSDPVSAALDRALERPELRPGAVQAWGLLTPVPCDRLGAFLRDADPEVRAAAATALGRCGADQLQPVKDALDAERDGKVRQALLETYARLGGDRAVGLLSATIDDPDAAVAFAAIRALGRTASPAAVQPLAATLTDPRPEFRVAALAALGEIADPRAGSAILARLDATSGDERQVALLAAARTAAADARPKIGEALHDDDPGVRTTAAEVLARVAGADAIPDLAARVDDEPDRSVREALTRAIVELGGAPAADG